MSSDYLIGSECHFGKMEEVQEMDGCDGRMTTHAFSATEPCTSGG